ncbi:unnamed protein product [Cladocopium goreaui]|uniref:28 kDa ribonucleoprotein, chloroplastic (28RNP) n=1 Tax=Cladocopium goreaui TaxID=2562237 RepID=A0A9P1FVX8_9DINO|nr:unnamed protein product [Cladocopium goreaui]
MTVDEASPLATWFSSLVGSSASSASKLPEKKVLEDEDKWDRERAFNIADSLENVRNLPADIKEKEVKYIFSKYGTVRSADVVMWPGLPTLCANGSLAPLEISLANRQKTDWQACAFITYSTADAAATAIRALNGVYRPRSSSPEPLAVMLARPGALPDPVQSGLMLPQAEDQVVALAADKGNFSSGGQLAASATASYVAEKTRCKLFVGNLHAEIPRERLSQVFGEWGRVVNVHVMTGKSKFGSACAFVEMATPAEAEIALKACGRSTYALLSALAFPCTCEFLSVRLRDTQMAGSGWLKPGP